MAKNLISVRWDDSIRSARALLEQSGAHYLAVFDAEGAVAGLVGARDLRDPNRTVGEVALLDVGTVDEHASLREVVDRMLQESSPAFFVTRGRDVVGIVGYEDLLKYFRGQLGEDSVSLQSLSTSPVVQEAIRELGAVGF